VYHNSSEDEMKIHRIRNSATVLWIRIRKDPKLFAGSGSGTRGYGSGSETGLEPYQKSSKNQHFDNYDIKNTLIKTFYFEKDDLKCHEKTFKIVDIVKE
jgi:hypothetical protein